jgi:DNA-binding LacI/PurR family transcriptional regulator
LTRKGQKKNQVLGSRVTMHQIAKRAEVSLGTVSHVINETARVREPLRSRVLDAIETLGYQPNQLSRGLRRNRTNIIGMIIPDITNPFFPAVVRGVEDVAYKSSYRIVLCNADNDPKKEIVYLNDLKSFLPAGILLIPSEDSSVATDPSGPHVVCIDRQPLDWNGDIVTVANEEGGYRAGRFLVQMGHRCIGIAAGPQHLVNAAQRLSGFLRALREAKIPIGAEYIQESAFDRAGGHVSAQRLLQLLPCPTAIFAANDLIALGVLSAVREFKLNCPRDVSVISFDALDLTEFTDPALTAIYQPGYQLGCTAAQLLIERITGMHRPAQKIVLKTELRIRNSVARLGPA